MRKTVLLASLVYLSMSALTFAAPPTYTISGVVSTAGGTPVEGVDVVGDNGAISTVTGADGAYSITVPKRWSGTVSVSKTGWLITPLSKSYTDVEIDMLNENYLAYQPKINGYVHKSVTPLEGATITADNGGGSDTADARGYYEFHVPYNWSGIVTANLTGYHFTDNSYTNVIADQVNQNFSGYQPTISGYVKKNDGTSLEGATVTADNGGGSDVTDASGYYEIVAPYDWSGTLTAIRLGWLITPNFYEFTSVISNISEKNYQAVNIGIQVNLDGSGDFTTIQSAIDAAIDGDIIYVNNGVYTGDGNRDIYFRGKALTVRGNIGDPSLVVIDCQGTDSVPHRGFNFRMGEGTDSILEGLTITNGYVSDAYGYLFPSSGGAILCENTGPTLQYVIFSSNTAQGGGGAIWNDTDCTTKISNCYFFDNHANGTGNDRGGGAIWNYYSHPLIINCNFVENYAPNGGAIKNYRSSPELIECYFQENHAGSDGGAINNYIESHPHIRNSFFINNKSNMRGGAVCNDYSSPSFSNCIFKRNNSSSYTNSFGGAIRNSESSPHFTHCTFYGNYANSGGDGFSNSNSSYPVITNSILWDWPKPIYNVSIPDVTDSRAIVSFSNVYGGYDGDGNISINPLFTDAGIGDYHLQPGSPCIDAGDNTAVTEPNDLDGLPRIIDGDCDGTPTVDMGAYEFDYFYLGDFEGDDCDVDLGDFAVMAHYWQQNNPAIDIAPYLDPDGIIDIQEMLILCEHWLNSN